MLCNGFTKLSLLAFYLRIAPFPKFQIPVWIVTGIVACYTAVITGLLLFSYNPMWMAWSAFPDASKCLNRPPLYIATAVANIVTDVVLFLLPIPMVAGLNMARCKKIGILIVFSLGTM